MHPIKEFEFSGIDKKLACEYIKIHNTILTEIKVIESVAVDSVTKSFLNIFISEFKLLNETDEKLIVDTIICASKNKLDTLFNKCSKINVFNNESIACNKLVGIGYYKNLQNRINLLNAISPRTTKQNNKLLKLQNEFNSTIELKSLLPRVFNYSGRRKVLLQYYVEKNFRVCAYCLAQYTSIYRSSKSKKYFLTGNLDHVKAKSTYPFLSLSINNLVPVCAHCNQRKLDSSFEYDPFNAKHELSFDFSDCIDVVKTKVVFKPLKDLKFSPAVGKFIDVTTKLDLKDLYQNFESNAKELIDRYHKFNSNGYSEHLSKITKRPNNRDFIEYFVSDTPLKEDSVLKHPLAKFKMDIFNTIKSKSKSKT